MKRIQYILGIVLMLASCNSLENEFGRIDQLDSKLPVPSPITIKEVRNVAGGAVIKVAIPDEDVIKGVVAVYDRGGKEVNTKISRYVDSLVIEGFSDTDPHEVKVSSFNVNEVRSTPVTVTVNPLTPAIVSAKADVISAFGGVKIHITGNESKSDLAICLMIDTDMSDKGKPVSEMKWVEVQTLFTASNDITLTRRNLDPVESVFGVYLRDKWGNVSDTTVFNCTPMEEIKLPAKDFKDARLADDNCVTTNASYYPVERLWDGSGSSTYSDGKYWFFASASDTPMPGWLTIDLGHTVQISRITTLPRIDYVIWAGGHVRDFEFWGSMEPTGEFNENNEHGFDDSWFLLGRFTQMKPSGYLPDGTVGSYTAEDREYFNAGNDFELDPAAVPTAYNHLRYLRCVFVNTFSTYELKAKVGQVQLGEITPYGQIIDE